VQSIVIDQTIKDEKDCKFYTCSTDKYLKLWNFKPNKYKEDEDYKPIQSYLTENPLLCMDHHASEPILGIFYLKIVTGGDNLEIVKINLFLSGIPKDWSLNKI
jgi:hypothetical protein